MILIAQYGVAAARVVGVEQREHAVIGLVAVAGERHVVLLVNRFQLGMESADHGVLETVALYLGPLLDAVRGDILGVDRLVERGPRVGSVGRDGGHQLVVFVGYGQLRSLLRHRVDLRVQRFALVGVGLGAVYLEQTLDLVEQGFLGLVVLRSELFGALEHEVFEVVGQTRRLLGIVLGAHLYGDVGLQARGFVVYGHVDLQSVVQSVDTGIERVARHALVSVLRTRCRNQRDGRCEHKQFHSHFT